MQILLFLLIVIAVLEGITRLMDLGWLNVLVCVLIVVPVLIYAIKIEGMAMEKRGRPLLIATSMAIPAAVLLGLVLGSGGLFN